MTFEAGSPRHLREHVDGKSTDSHSMYRRIDSLALISLNSDPVLFAVTF